MRRPAETGRQTGERDALAARAGLRRIDWVRVDATVLPPRCEASGVGHRLPVAVAVPVSLAAAMISAGVPASVRLPRDETPATLVV